MQCSGGIAHPLKSLEETRTCGFCLEIFSKVAIWHVLKIKATLWGVAPPFSGDGHAVEASDRFCIRAQRPEDSVFEFNLSTLSFAHSQNQGGITSLYSLPR